VASPPSPGETCCAIPGYSADDATGIHLTNAIANHIGDEEVTRTIDRHAGGIVDLSIYRCSTVAGVAWSTVARNSTDDATRIDFANAMIKVLKDKKVVSAIHGHAQGAVELSACRRSAIACVTCCAVAGYSADGATWIDFANAIVVLINDEKITCTVHYRIAWPVELSTRCRSAIARIPAGAIPRHGIDEGGGPGSRANRNKQCRYQQRTEPDSSCHRQPGNAPTSLNLQLIQHVFSKLLDSLIFLPCVTSALILK
jgi:hypothetical protein